MPAAGLQAVPASWTLSCSNAELLSFSTHILHSLTCYCNHQLSHCTSLHTHLDKFSSLLLCACSQADTWGWRKIHNCTNGSHFKFVTTKLKCALGLPGLLYIFPVHSLLHSLRQQEQAVVQTCCLQFSFPFVLF
jgi:hypothetical protein